MGGGSALVCSWAVKRAFDSVSRMAIRMALNRLEVPRNIKNMVLKIEVERITIVRTPLKQYIYIQDWFKSHLIIKITEADDD